MHISLFTESPTYTEQTKSGESNANMPRLNLLMNDHTTRAISSFQNHEDISTGLLARFVFIPVQENFPTSTHASRCKWTEDRGTILNVIFVLYLHVIKIPIQY